MTLSSRRPGKAKTHADLPGLALPFLARCPARPALPHGVSRQPTLDFTPARV
ncbi:hypothetical protein [Nitratidesulfovibrio termitidis]|uniref:hypothetical protein n=1 Tax=Nitratidesulfovibrio termitidis TaxID=42252 RepID=UPI0012EB9D4C|nr:hypothetical protein [Nitratidesulfovibrio termitidis]